MSKRRAGTELTHDNWDQEDEEQEGEVGSFQAADETTLAKRQIRKAKRRYAGGENKPEASSNPFSAFKGFSGFSGATAATTKKPELSFGGTNDKPKVALTPAESTAPVISSFVMKSSSNQTSTTSTSSDSKSVNGSSLSSSTNMNPEYLKKLKMLNQSVSAWITKHVDASPMCDLTPVFDDYKKHLHELQDKYSDVPAESTSSSTDTTASETATKSSTSVASGFNFNKAATTTTTSPSQSTAAFTFKATPASSGVSTGTTASSSVGFSFMKSAATTTTAAPSQGAFSFKPTQASTGAALSGFSFMKGSTEASTSGGAQTKPFSFGLGGAPAAAPAKEGASGDAEEDEPPKVEFKQVEEKDALYSKRCKLFYKKDDAYKDRGVGMLHIKKTGNRGQLLLRADTNLGNVILNVGIQSGMPATRQGKNNVLIMTAMNPPIEKKCPKCKKNYPNPQESNRCETENCSPDVEPILLRVKTGEDADQLLEEINKLKE